MTDKLLNWLNNEVKLSTKITNITDQFKNGYYFGELLSRYKLIQTFSQFKNTQNPLDTTRNYCHLQVAFNNLGIQLTEVQKDELLKKKKYKAEMYLFKLKQKLSNKLINLDSITALNYKSELPHLYKDLTIGKISNPRVKSAHLNINAENSRKSLSEQRKKLQSALNPIRSKKAQIITTNKNFEPMNSREQKLINDIVNEENHLLTDYNEAKNKIYTCEANKHKNEVNKDTKNLNSWRKQMEIMTDFKENQKEEYNKKRNFYAVTTINEFEESAKNNLLIIDKFDKNLAKLGLDLKSIEPKTYKKKDTEKTVSSEIFLQRIKNQMIEKENSKKDQMKRQRKIYSANIQNLNNMKLKEKQKEEEIKQLMQKEREYANYSCNTTKTQPNFGTQNNLNTTNSTLNNNTIKVQNNLNLGDNSNNNCINLISSPQRLNILIDEDEQSVKGNKKRDIQSACKTNSAFYRNTTRPTTALNPLNKNRPQTAFTFSSDWNDYISVDIFNANRFFNELNKETLNYRKYINTNNQKKRERDRKLILPMVYRIIDLVEECHVYQNTRLEELIDIETWKNYADKFIHGIKFNDNCYDLESKNKNDEDNVKHLTDFSGFWQPNAKDIEECKSKKIGNYEYDELLNYLNYCGDYKVTYNTVKKENKDININSNSKKDKNKNMNGLNYIKLDVNDVMGKEIQLLINENDGKFPTINIDINKSNDSNEAKETNQQLNKPQQLLMKNELYEPRQEDLELLKVPKEYTYDYFYSDMLNKILKLHFGDCGDNNTIAIGGDIDATVSIKNEIQIEDNSKLIDNNEEANEQNNKSKDIESINHKIVNNNNTISDQLSISKLLSSFPIKASFMGAKYAGKKTQAKLINELFPNIKIYSITDMILELLEAKDTFNMPIDNNPKLKNLKKNQIDQMKINKEKSELLIKPYIKLLNKLETYAKNEKIDEFKEIEMIRNEMMNSADNDSNKENVTSSPPARKLSSKKSSIKIDSIFSNDGLVNKQLKTLYINLIAKIDPDIKIDFLIQSIKKDFTYKDRKTLEKEIQKMRENKQKYEVELEKIKEEQLKKPKVKVKEEQNLIDQIKSLSCSLVNGFIIIDFPKNVEEARIFEFKINNYCQKIEQDKTEIEIQSEKMHFLCDKEITCNKSSIKNSALNKIFFFDIDDKDIFNRLTDRKIDPQTGTIYNMNEDPPSDKKILSRLEDYEPPNEDNIKNDLSDFLKNYDDIMEFYLNFNINKSNILSNQTKNEILDNIKSIILLMTEKFENEILPILPEPKNEAQIEPQANNNNNNNNISLNNNTFLGSSNKASKNDILSNAAEDPNASVVSKNFNTIKSVKSIKSIKTIRSGVKKKSSRNQFYNLNNNVNNLNNNSKINELTLLKLPQDIISNIFLNWISFSDNYIFYYKKIFFELQHSNDNLIKQMTKYQDDFIEFLCKPSEKRNLISKFIEKYMCFSDKYEELRENEIVKTDFNNDLVEITEEIWKIIQNKKNESIKELNKITSSDFVNNEINEFYYNLEQMILLETEKMIASINNLSFILSSPCCNFDIKTYSNIAKDERYINRSKGKCNILAYELIKNTENLLPIKEVIVSFAKSKNKKTKIIYPKLERLYKNCYVILFKIVNHIKSQNEKFNIKTCSEISSSLIKKKKGKNENQNYTTEMDDLAKVSISNQILKYKYRLNLLINFGIKSIRKIYNTSQKIFKEMDDWIVDSVKYQNNSMNEIISELKEKINNEGLNEYEFKKEMDNFKNKFEPIDIVNLLEIEKQSEKIKDDQNSGGQNEGTGENEDEDLLIFSDQNLFNQTYFNSIIKSVRDLEIQYNIISKQNFIEVFFVKNVLFNDTKNYFSEKLKKYNFHNFSYFLDYFVFLSSDVSIKNEKNEEENKNQSNIKVNAVMSSNTINSNSTDNKKNKSISQPQELILTNAIMTVLFLFNTNLINEDDAYNIRDDYEDKVYRNSIMSKNDFLSIKFWFEDDKEFINDIQVNSEEELADKIKMFKNILFDLNKMNDNEINIDNFIEVITLQRITKAKNCKLIDESMEKYSDLFEK